MFFCVAFTGAMWSGFLRDIKFFEKKINHPCKNLKLSILSAVFSTSVMISIEIICEIIKRLFFLDFYIYKLGSN
jgi:hypothetical protein